jgi:hypothetical protein
MEPEEALIWMPVLADPPLATYNQMIDGTYSIVDVLDMVAMMRYKAANMPKVKQ